MADMVNKGYPVMILFTVDGPTELGVWQETGKPGLVVTNQIGILLCGEDSLWHHDLDIGSLDYSEICDLLVMTKMLGSI